MSKVAAYLQEHILGEVSTNAAVISAMSRDGGVLEIKPEMVVYPRTTNDIRKVARFAWQLAEKGHVLPLTARGNGTDQTGAAIGSGIVLSLPAHMNRLLEFDAKQKLVRVQPGLNAKALSDALALHGVGIPALPEPASRTTLGGAVANNASSPLSGKYGDMGEWTRQLEVVLANGDVLQTERLSKRDLNKKKGLQTFEGEIYRSIDNIIEDNKELVSGLLAGPGRDNVGYSSLAKVKHKDGSFDLTPLLVGSQGTLGIISEMILKSDFVSAHMGVAAIAFTTKEAARDALDQLVKAEPAFLEYYGGELFTIAAMRGKKYDLFQSTDDGSGAVILLGFDDFSDRVRQKKLKRIAKLLKGDGINAEIADGEEALSLLAIREVTAFVNVPEHKDASAPPIVDGAFVPAARFEEFSNAVEALGVKHQVALPVHARVLEGIVYARPTLLLRKVGDKQKVFKLLEEYTALISQFGGHLISEDGEGRVKARFAHKELDDEVLAVFAAVKSAFDPFGILNPGVKQVLELRQLVSHLRSDYDTAAFAEHAAYN
jgi:FAD/FMN-containing dehydrogenase